MRHLCAADKADFYDIADGMEQLPQGKGNPWPGRDDAWAAMRASLPMYDLPGLEAATDAWWAGLAAAFRAEGLHQVPERLTREGGHAALWTAPDLLFSQTCGYSLAAALAGVVPPARTPHPDRSAGRP